MGGEPKKCEMNLCPRMTSSRRKFRARPAAARRVFLAAVLAGNLVCAQNNPLTTAPARLRIEKLAQTDWPAKVGVVEFAPNPAAPGRFGVFGADGKPVSFQTVWAASGEATRICFDTSSGAAAYVVCFGDNLPSAGGGWKPEAGVLLETRACRADLPVYDDYRRMQRQNPPHTSDRVLGRRAAGSLVDHFVAVAERLQITSKCLRIGLAALQAVTRRNAVAIADHDGPTGGWLLRGQAEGGRKNHSQRNNQTAEYVHRYSVAKRRSFDFA